MERWTVHYVASKLSFFSHVLSWYLFGLFGSICLYIYCYNQLSTILVLKQSLLLLVVLKRISFLLNEPHRSTKCSIRILSLIIKGQETLVLLTNAVKIKESTGWTAKAKGYIRNSEWSQSKFSRFPAESWESAELGLWTSSFAITKRKCKLKTELEPEPPCLIAKTPAFNKGLYYSSCPAWPV